MKVCARKACCCWKSSACGAAPYHTKNCWMAACALCGAVLKMEVIHVCVYVNVYVYLYSIIMCIRTHIQ